MNLGNRLVSILDDSVLSPFPGLDWFSKRLSETLEREGTIGCVNGSSVMST